MKTITVIGATGSLAAPIIKELTSKGVKVKAIVRDIKKAKELLPKDVNVVFGDVADKQSLQEALKGTETIYLSLNTTSWDIEAPFHAEREGIINVVDVSKELGINHIMQIVGIDLSNPEFATKAMTYKTNLIRIPAINYLKKSSINYTYFHCSFFIDSFPVFIQDKKFSIIGNHKYPMYYTNTSDFAENIFNAIENQKVFNKSYTVQGKEGMSFPEAAKKFLSVYNPDIEVVESPIETIKHIGLSSKDDELFMEHMLTYVEQLKEEFVSKNTWKELGKPKFSIADFTLKLKGNG
jgi:uncharacterized protein YbjT (DUF2867 family)